MSDENISNENINIALEESLLEFYLSQETLGKEFSKVLYDNLWDLYES